MDQDPLPEEQVIERVVTRMNAGLVGVVLGLLCGVVLFLATIWLVIKGGPNPGAHLVLLSQYFPGYSVTFSGSIVGFFYAFLAGLLTGAVLGAVYNKLAR